MTTEQRLQVVPAAGMDDETFLRHWRARHSDESTICHDPEVSWSRDDIRAARAYHERLHNHRGWGKRLGTVDPQHDHVSG